MNQQNQKKPDTTDETTQEESQSSLNSVDSLSTIISNIPYDPKQDSEVKLIDKTKVIKDSPSQSNIVKSYSRKKNKKKDSRSSASGTEDTK